MTSPLQRLFVYGTLMRGEANAQVMSAARFVGPARTLSTYRLVLLEGYPALLPGGGAGVAVTGELYLVDERHLVELDRFEGHPTLFRRQPVLLAGGDSAQAYFWASQDAAAGQAPIVADGDWRRFRRRAPPEGLR